MKPYQYALAVFDKSGNVSEIVPFGRGTNIPISKPVQIQTYNVNKQDYQVVRTDEVRFGIDTLTPGLITFNMAALENYALPNMASFGSVPEDLFPIRGSDVAKLAKAWKANETRSFWGAVTYLLFCDRDGTVVRIYGRPGKFMYAPKQGENDSWIDVQAEFRRADTYAHSNIEYFVGDPTDSSKGLKPGGDKATATRGYGDADSWVRFLLNGPMSNPKINYGGNILELSSEIGVGTTIEVSSYPWSRRVVDNNGKNRRTEVIGDTMYLDQIKFPADEEIDITWTCDDSSDDTSLYFLWREAQNVI